MKSIPSRTKNSAMPLVYSSLERLVYHQHQAQTNQSNWMWVSRIKLGDFDVRHQIAENLYDFSKLLAKSSVTTRQESHLKLANTFSYLMLMLMARYDGRTEVTVEKLFDAFESSIIHRLHSDEVNRCIRRIVGQLDKDLSGTCSDFFRLMRMVDLNLTKIEEIYFNLSESGMGEAVTL